MASEPERNGHKLNNDFQKFIGKIDKIIADENTIPHLNADYIDQLKQKIEALERAFASELKKCGPLWKLQGSASLQLIFSK